ncbi:hypothetical protein OOU_Y34scaffold00462g21 [Pyricularia oryzae Y34]|uniref:Uncharacterized protein n=2 Tax=Pyricularia oryzae TaxID=318829 RepID=A0AA97PMH9_PYRO3|nr:hypothetical protein OOU_Y34scaffold00462g21 [Pyricularia oryzae Y34]
MWIRFSNLSKFYAVILLWVFGGRSISRKSIGGKEKLLYSAYYDGHQH